MRPGAGAISAVIGGDLAVNKATATSDDETSLIHCAYAYFRALGSVDWLRKPIREQTVLERLDRALAWLYTARLDSTSGLIRRGHTTDWGDVKAERGGEPTDIDPVKDAWTASIYDQALTYRAALELAAMHRAAGNATRAQFWEQRARDLRDRTQQSMWQPERGTFRIHLHLTPLTHSFSEERVVTIMNALAVEVGLATPVQAPSIFAAMERARLDAGVRKPGLVLYPPYPAGFFAVQSGQGEYQNGGAWDWWGGMQILSEFRNGAAALALRHLQQVASDWALHPDRIYEWQEPGNLSGHGSPHYASAAGSMGTAIVKGLYGVDLNLESLTLEPRLARNSGGIRVLQPATGRSVSYAYRFLAPAIQIDYATDVPGPVQLRVLLPAEAVLSLVRLDGDTTAAARECTGADCYAVFVGPSGQHQVIIALR